MADVTNGTWILYDKAVDAVYQNGVKIYGRNLALETDKIFTTIGSGSTNDVKRMYSQSNTIAKGTTVTLAFDIMSTSATGKYAIQFLGGEWQGISELLPLTVEKQHHSYTIVTDADYSDGIQIRIDNSTAKVTVSNFIVSQGSKEVPWTRAPEDILN